jgi:hypothetical protein
VRSAIAHATQLFGRIDYAVHSAGVSHVLSNGASRTSRSCVLLVADSFILKDSRGDVRSHRRGQFCRLQAPDRCERSRNLPGHQPGLSSHEGLRVPATKPKSPS